MRRLAVHCAWLAALAGCLESPPASGSGDGGPGTGHPCGTTFALHDDFDGAELDEWRWGTMGTTTLGNDGVRITSVTGFANLHSATHYQVKGSQVVAQVDVTGVADAAFVMELDSSLNYQVGLRLEDSTLGLRVVDANGEQTVLTAPLEREQGFWRLREEDGGFFWAQSADGETWDEEHGPFAADIGEVAHVDFDLTPDVEQAAVVVQSVNPGNDSAPYCPASSLTDDFTTESQRWEVHEQGDCMVTLSDGLWLGYSAQAFCALTSRERFDLEGSAFAVGLLAVRRSA